MKLSTQEEYGLRCLLQLARVEPPHSLSIPEISQAEGLSTHNVAKLLRILRQGGFVRSERGQHGGYRLARPASGIRVGQVLEVLGGRLYDPAFCAQHAGGEAYCNPSFSACSLRALWDRVQRAVDDAVRDISLQDLVRHGHYKFEDAGRSDDQLLQITL